MLSSATILAPRKWAETGPDKMPIIRGDNDILEGLAALSLADPRLAAPFLEGFNNAALAIFWVALGVVLIAFVLSWFLKAAPLRAKSALQEASDDAAAAAAVVEAEQGGALVAPGTEASESDPTVERK